MTHESKAMSEQELHTLPYELWARKSGADHAVRVAYYADLDIAHYVCEQMLVYDYFAECYVTDSAGLTRHPNGVPA